MHLLCYVAAAKVKLLRLMVQDAYVHSCEWFLSVTELHSQQVFLKTVLVFMYLILKLEMIPFKTFDIKF